MIANVIPPALRGIISETPDYIQFWSVDFNWYVRYYNGGKVAQRYSENEWSEYDSIDAIPQQDSDFIQEARYLHSLCALKSV